MKFLLTLLIVLVLLLKLQFKFTPEFVVVDSRRAVTATVNYQYRRRAITVMFYAFYPSDRPIQHKIACTPDNSLYTRLGAVELGLLHGADMSLQRTVSSRS